MRPICNLGKKQRVLAESSGAVLVKPSINDKLADAHQALTYEKVIRIAALSVYRIR
jgi:hypothetical protein